MQHLLVTPMIAGVVTASVIYFLPAMPDRYNAKTVSIEPVVERLDLDYSSGAAAPAEMQVGSEVIARTLPFNDPRPHSGPSMPLAQPSAIADATPLRRDVKREPIKLAAIDVTPMSAADTPDQTRMPLLEVAVDRLNLRGGPGTDFEALGRLSRGALLEQMGETDGVWVKVAVLSSGINGWLHSDYVMTSN